MTTSKIEDYDQWRQISNGGTRYRFLKMTGRLTAEEATIDWSAIIRSQDLLVIANELFPPPIIIGNIAIPQPGTMPGVPNLVAQEISFESLDGIDLPIDPFNADPSAVAGTYGQFLKIVINFAPSNKLEPDVNDPRTFLEISSSTAGEVIYIPPTATKVVEETNDQGVNDGTPGTTVDANTGEIRGTIAGMPAKRNRHPDSILRQTVPLIEWSLTWKQVPWEIFRTVMVHRLRLLNNRVNNTIVPFLYDAPPESLLFKGFDVTESYTWKNGMVNAPPVDVTMKVLEKRVIWRGIPCGHNHMFVPGVGWQRLVLNDGGPLYQNINFNFLWQQ